MKWLYGLGYLEGRKLICGKATHMDDDEIIQILIGVGNSDPETSEESADLLIWEILSLIDKFNSLEGVVKVALVYGEGEVLH